MMILKMGMDEIVKNDITILYEDQNLIVAVKPAGMVVHGYRVRNKSGESEFTERGTLVEWLRARYPEIVSVGDDPETRPGLVHRLDRDTSGVLVVARNQKTFEYLKKLFQTRDIEKRYLALVVGHFKETHGVIDAPIGIKTGSVKRSVRGNRMVKEAKTEYWVKREFGGASGNDNGSTLLEVAPKTGRTHQIRVHLASIGHPVLGDSLYGGRRSKNGASRLMLHAESLTFTSPDGKRLKFEAPPPDDFKTALRELSTRPGLTGGGV